MSNCVRLTDTGFHALSQVTFVVVCLSVCLLSVVFTPKGCRDLEIIDLEECVLVRLLLLLLLLLFFTQIHYLTNQLRSLTSR